MKLRLEKWSASGRYFTARDEEGRQHNVTFFDDALYKGEPKKLQGRYVTCELAPFSEMAVNPKLLESDAP